MSSVCFLNNNNIIIIILRGQTRTSSGCRIYFYSQNSITLEFVDNHKLVDETGA